MRYGVSYRWIAARVRPSFGVLLAGLVMASGPAHAQPELALNSPVFSPPVMGETLTGGVRQSVILPPAQPDGLVLDAATGQPLAGATISLPAGGQQLLSDAQGRFALPRSPERPVIVSVGKPGYLSASVTVRPGETGPFQVRLSKHQARKELVLDDQLRHLGDNSYAPNSAGADRFRRSAEGTALVRRFRLLSPPPGEYVTLHIGTVLGLDTHAARSAGQSGFHHASSPMLVRLNGALVHKIELNGDGQRLRLPAALMREVNTLVIETGHHRPDGTYVDYDDVELMHLVLVF